MRRISRVAAGLGLFAIGHAVEAEPDYPQIWSAAELYRTDSGVVRGINLSGRAQYDLTYINDDKDSYDEAEWRRFRFGAVTTLADGWKVHVEGDFDFNERIGSSYSRLTDAYLGKSLDNGWSLKLLKSSAGFTLDGATSSKQLITPERNNLSNNLWFPAEYFTGVDLRGDCGPELQCRFAVFSADDADEISGFDASWFGLVSLDWDIASRWGLERADLRFDFVHNDEDAKANTRPLTDVLSTTLQLRQGRWHFSGELAYALGFDEAADLGGVVLMPFYDLTPRWQLVARYTGLTSSEDGGIRVNRYERPIVESRGDAYHELFLGLNWYGYGHRLKWQNGLHHVWLNDDAGESGDYDGWGIVSALRLYW